MVMSNDRTAFLIALATPLAASLGLELWGVEVAGSSRPVLRLFVEKAGGAPDTSGVTEFMDVEDEFSENECSEDGFSEDGSAGVTVDQCAELSRLLGLTLDVEDPFAAAWTLEVSSPGLERQFFRLDQMRPYLGRSLELALVDGHPDWPVSEGSPLRKKFRGVLEQVSDTAFTLNIPAATRRQDEPERVHIPWDNVRKATLIHAFPEPGLPGKSKAGKNAAQASAQEQALAEEDAGLCKDKKPRSASGGKHES